MRTGSSGSVIVPSWLFAMSLLLLGGSAAAAPPFGMHRAAGEFVPRGAPLQALSGVPSGMLPIAQRLLHPSRFARQVPSGARPMAGGKFISAAQYYGSDVVIYSVSPSGAQQVRRNSGTTLTYFETLTGFSDPGGTVVTPSGNWYIANQGDANVPVYHFTKTGPRGPVRRLDDSGQQPIDVDSTADESLVAVSNIVTASLGSGSVSLYAGGSTIPTGTLGVADVVEGIGIALDKSENCYWSYNDESVGGAYIVEFPHCGGSATTVVSGLGFAGGLAFDKHGNLFYSDQDSGIYKCHKTSSCSLLASGFSDVAFINFDANWQHLWVADVGGAIYALDPISGAVLSSTPDGGSGGPPFGIAPDPGAKY